MARGQREMRQLMRVIREAIREGEAERALVDNLSGEPFGAQRALEYYTPARGGSPRVRDLIASKTVRRRMRDQIERGIDMGADKWYDTAPLAAAFNVELGEKEGAKAFRRFMEFNAATSPRARVDEQLKRASLFYGEERQGGPLSLYGGQPEGYGHFAHNTAHRRLIEQLLKNENLSPRTAPKTASYAENLSGNHDPVTVDSHAVALPAIMSGDPRWLKAGGDPVERAGEPFNPRNAFASGEIDVDDALESPGWWGGRPLDSEYAHLADYYRKLGDDYNLTGPQAQAAAWVGGGDITGVQSGPEPFMRHLADRLRATAEARGQSFEEALRDMIKGGAPLLSLPLFLAALRAALSEESERT